jgi:hypothetical protein
MGVARNFPIPRQVLCFGEPITFTHTLILLTTMHTKIIRVSIHAPLGHMQLLICAFTQCLNRGFALAMRRQVKYLLG